MADQVKKGSSKRSVPLQEPQSDSVSKRPTRPTSIIHVPKKYKIHILGTDLAHDDKKPYTVYKLEVTRDVDAWVIYRRYRQFHALYTELKSAFGADMKKCGDFPPKQVRELCRFFSGFSKGRCVGFFRLGPVPIGFRPAVSTRHFYSRFLKLNETLDFAQLESALCRSTAPAFARLA